MARVAVAMMLSTDGTYYIQGAQTCPGVCIGTTSPLTNTGTGKIPVIGCMPASASSGGCVTDGGQSISGAKAFTDTVTAPTVLTSTVESQSDGQSLMVLGKQSGTTATPDVIVGSAYARTGSQARLLSGQAGGVEKFYVDGDGQIFPGTNVQLTGLGAFVGTYIESLFGTNLIFTNFQDNVSDVGSAYSFDTYFARNAGNLFVWRNHGVARSYQSYNGTLSVVSAGDNAAFSDDTGISGHLALTAGPPGPTAYLFTAGQLPTTYWGFHGATTLGNTVGMQSGFLFEVTNPLKGDFSDKKFMIDYLGGLYPAGSAQPESLFGICGNYQNNPENDGGQGYYVMTDAGVEQEGSMRYASDKHRWCYCQPLAGDGGPVGSTGDGWIRIKDEQPCAL